MPFEGNGELIPVGGGDSIPLVASPLTVGRRESCDICLNFPNVSGKHCELTFRSGFWIIRDLGSTNGIKVNGERVEKKVLAPGDAVIIGKRPYTIQYTPTDRMSKMEDLMEDEEEDIMGVPLMEKAGLDKPRRHPPRPKMNPLGDPSTLSDDEDDD